MGAIETLEISTLPLVKKWEKKVLRVRVDITLPLDFSCTTQHCDQ